jgi:hypothetical protein
MNMPITYEQNSMSQYWMQQSGTVEGQNTSATLYEKRYLYQLIFSRFKFGLPKDWDLNFFRYWLFSWGSIAVMYTREYGWICAPYSVSQINMYWNPKEIVITNSYLTNPKYGVIGVNSGIIKLFDDYGGLDDLVRHYAVKLAQIDRCIDVNLMNANVTKYFEARNKKHAQEIKDLYAQSTQGEPLVVANESVTKGKQIDTLYKDIKTTYIVNDLLQSKRTIINEFLTKIGIANANYDKRERLNTDEVNQNDEETKAMINVIYDNIKEGIAEINAISGLGITVELTERGDSNDTATDDTVRNV